MYQKDTQFTSSFKSKKLYNGLIALRFLSSFFILFLLLTPLIHRKYNIEEKPIVGIAIDNSTSILHSKANSQKKIEDNIKKLQEKLDGKCTVVPFSFGTQCQSDSLFSFSEKETDISQALEYFDESYIHQNPVALVVASDGLYNKGINPIYTTLQKKYPIYTIALGDTTIKKDTRIEDVHHNTFAYLGDKTSIEINLGADFANGALSNLSIYEINSGASTKISSHPISINSNNFISTQTLTVECKRAGIVHYRAVLDAVKGEEIVQNNSFDFFIEVLDGRKKILIVGASPHPDMSALKQSLQNSKNYEVDITFDQSLLSKIESYNLVILHQMPSETDNASDWIQRINTLKIPVLFIIGSQSDLNIFSSIQNNISAQLQANVHQDILPKINANFELFSLTDETKATANTFPPLQIDLSSVTAKSVGSTLMYQKIGSVETQYPLIFFGDNNGVKNGYIIGTGLWKWNLTTYATTSNHEAFDEIIHKIANYLSVKKDGRPFRTNLSKSIYKENENITIDAQLYNESFEMINTPDASIELINEKGNKYNYTFGKKENFYQLELGLLTAGDYRYTASTNYGGKKQIATGSFIVKPLQMEFIKTTADHKLLKALALKNKGEMYSLDQIDQLTEAILKMDMKSILYEKSKTHPLLDLWWMLILIIGLMATEWFLRKYNGGY